MRNKKPLRLMLIFVWYLILGFCAFIGHKFLSIDWMIIPIILTMVIFFAFKIDSRYLILNAIMLLWLIPFLLFFRLEEVADTIAIYAYYFLVSGVILQLLLKEPLLELEYLRNLFKGMEFFYVMLFFALVVTSMVFEFNPIVKAVSLCFFVTALILIAAKHLFKK